MAPISVLLVDDNAIVAEAMPRILAGDPRFTWLGWMDDVSDLVAHVTRTCPSIVLMDIDMPGVDTFELVRKLTVECPETKVVMFSGHVREEYTDAAIDAGAYGYLHKDDDFRWLLDSLERAHQGEVVLSPLVQRTLWRE